LRFKSLTILLAIVYTVLAVEVLLRIMAPVPMKPRYVNAAPYGVRGNDPNRSYRHSTVEYNILIRTNSMGIRADYEIPYEKPSGTKRVVLLGDSFGMGYGVNADEMFTARMSHYLKYNYGLVVEVVNLATSGHGNAEELIVLLNEGFKYSPDLVLLSWHYTDLEDNVRSNLFKLVDGKLVENANSYLPGVKQRQFLNNFPVYRYITERSQLYNFLRNWAGGKVKQWLVKVRFNTAPLKKDSNKANKKIKKRYREELTMALLTKIERECRKKDSRLLILDVPFKLSRTKFSSRFPYKYISNANPLSVISPIEKFKEKRGEQIYWEKGDGHFTPLGCDLVGKALADHIYNVDLLGPVKK
jgi:hypothetical protein